MKKRVKTDSTILHFVIILTGLLYVFPQLYANTLFFDNIFDFIGLFIVLTGTFLRMSGRAYKKSRSRKGDGLVVSGPYTIVRNPMYLGSFLMGAGFVLIVWPWWTLPIFVVLFYLRFQRQIVLEEEHLEKMFGESYKNYCRNVPRIFPDLTKARKMKFAEIFPFEELWTTQEKNGLAFWPFWAVLLETFQENVVFKHSNVNATLQIFAVSMLFFALILLILYKRK